MKTIFLDFDGVLNNSATLERLQTILSTPYVMDRDNVEVLNEIVSRVLAPDAAPALVPALALRIVISSSWRYNHTLAECRLVLATFGFRFPGLVTDATSTNVISSHTPEGHFPRGDEIQAWIDREYLAPSLLSPESLVLPHPLLGTNDMLILDDAPVGPAEGPLARRTVAPAVKPSTGLLPEHVPLALKILNLPFAKGTP